MPGCAYCPPALFAAPLVLTALVRRRRTTGVAAPATGEAEQAAAGAVQDKSATRPSEHASNCRRRVRILRTMLAVLAVVTGAAVMARA